MNGAQFLVRALEAEGVDTLFGYPGGTIMPFYDALIGSRLTHILVRHEQGAALAANGWARRTGRVGVCVATSGPGAANLLTGIADAFLDSVPMVAITGQVATALMGTDAFQELDVYGMSLPTVKHSFLVRRVEDLPRVVREAFHIARSGRPGPVLIDLPKDVQMAAADHLDMLPRIRPTPLSAPAPDAVERARSLLAQAKRPVIYGGGGLVIGDAIEAFREFVTATGIPTVLTLKGLGALPASHPLFLGMLGMHGTQAANLAVQESDLLICVGARFDDRATGKLAEFAPHARIIHLDGDAAEIGKLRAVHAALHGDLREGLQALSDLRPDCRTWREACLMRARKTAARYDAPTEQVYAPAMLKRMSERIPQAVVCCDVGQHQMWVAQHWRFDHPRKHLTSGGLGTMGFGLPAAIGVQRAEPGALVVNVTGDGSFMMNVQELATVARYRLPIKIVLLDNQALGMVRQWQHLFFNRRYSEIDLSDNPDFGALAAAFGIPSLHLDRGADLDAAIEAMLAVPGPCLMHVAIDQQANVWPLVPPNRSNTEMLESENPHALPA